MKDKTIEESIRITLMEMTIMTDVWIGLEKGYYPVIELEV